MGVKEFFKPSWKKLIIFGIIFTFTSVTGLLHEMVTLQKNPFHFIGSPLPYYFECDKTKVVCPEMSATFNIVALFSDIILWYIVACSVCILLK